MSKTRTTIKISLSLIGAYIISAFAENTLVPSPSQSALIFEEQQQILRKRLWHSKPNTTLKSSILEELYLRGLVKPVDKQIIFHLPFNLHGYDCGAPDCYSTNLAFEIPLTQPVQFPETISINQQTSGCGIEGTISKRAEFTRQEVSPQAVNYYSAKLKSHLLIIRENAQLYYFPDSKRGDITLSNIDNVLSTMDADDPKALIPYRSTMMETNDYANFLFDE